MTLHRTPCNDYYREEKGTRKKCSALVVGDRAHIRDKKYAEKTVYFGARLVVGLLSSSWPLRGVDHPVKVPTME